jgi:hypothetical protein
LHKERVVDKLAHKLTLRVCVGAKVLGVEVVMEMQYAMLSGEGEKAENE